MSAANPGDRAGWFWVCIEDLTDGVIRGSIQNQYQTEPFLFCGLDQFLEIAELSMDVAAFPQSNVTRRRFSAAARGECGPEPEEEGPDPLARRGPATPVRPNFVVRYGRYGVFDIRVLYRRNASWQGEAVYFNRRHKFWLAFRSALELTGAMRHILTDRVDTEDWEEEQDGLEGLEGLEELATTV